MRAWASIALCLLSLSAQADQRLHLTLREKKDLYTIFTTHVLIPEQRDAAIDARAPLTIDKWPMPITVAIASDNSMQAARAERKILKPLLAQFSAASGIPVETLTDNLDTDIVVFLDRRLAHGFVNRALTEPAQAVANYLRAGAGCAALPSKDGSGHIRYLLGVDLEADWKQQRHCLGNGIASALGLHGNIGGDPSFRPGETGALAFARGALVSLAALYQPEIRNGMTLPELKRALGVIGKRLVQSAQ